MPVSRRLFLGATLPWLAACTTPLPFGPRPPGDALGAQRLQASAAAHGLDAYRRLHDVSVSYDGQWRPFVDRIQPEVVDAGYRGRSQERLIPAANLCAQAYDGDAGHKQVVWRRGMGDDTGQVAVWRNGTPSTDVETLRAAALVAEGYRLFLFGPMAIVDRALSARSAGSEKVDGRTCDVVDVWLMPGLGLASLDRVALCIDRSDDTMRRIRFTLEGTSNTQGAVAEVDTFDHERRFGLLWPMRSYERVVHPLRLPAHDWHVTGLDVDRGFSAAEISGSSFTGAAAAPAGAVVKG